jgi:hypothetical protein
MWLDVKVCKKDPGMSRSARAKHEGKAKHRINGPATTNVA